MKHHLKLQLSFFFSSGLPWQTYNLLPPPESSKSRHSKQLKPPDDSFTTTAINSSNSSNIENINMKKQPKILSSNDENWLNANDVIKLSGKTSNQINSAAEAISSNENNRNGIKLSSSAIASPTNELVITTTGDDSLLHTAAVTTTTPSSLISGLISSSSSAAHYIDAFSDLDPLGKKAYIDKKYFFQDLKNPPKKVLKDLSDRDGFSASFLSDQKNATEFSIFHEKSLVDNSTLSQKQDEQSDEFVAQFNASSTQIFSPNNNGTHGTPPNLSRSSETSK